MAVENDFISSISGNTLKGTFLYYIQTFQLNYTMELLRIRLKNYFVFAQSDFYKFINFQFTYKVVYL